MKFTIFQDSRIGGREHNQDRLSYCYSRDSLLMIVADGMGGHLHGEVAAQIAVQYLTEAFQRESRPRLPDPVLFLSWGFSNAHHAIADYAAAHDLPESPRTTCVACVVQDGCAWWAHAGDSRLYHLRGGRLLARTRDHSRVQLMVDQGQLTPEEALHHPARNRVYSCLGGDHTPQVDFSHRTPLTAGDVLLLCSDGFWGPLEEALIEKSVAGAGIMQAVPQLMAEAERRAGAGSDNLSALAVNWDGGGEDARLAVETRTMPLDAHTTQMEGFRAPGQRDPTLTEEDIERAIDEIRGAIRKYSR